MALRVVGLRRAMANKFIRSQPIGPANNDGLSVAYLEAWKSLQKRYKEAAEKERIENLLRQSQGETINPLSLKSTSQSKLQKNEQYYKDNFLVPPDNLPIAEHLDIDKSTHTIKNFGFDQQIEEITDNVVNENRLTHINAMLRKLDIESIDDLQKSAGKIHIQSHEERVKKGIFDQEQAKEPYKGIGQQKNPKSIRIQREEPLYYQSDILQSPKSNIYQHKFLASDQQAEIQDDRVFSKLDYAERDFWQKYPYEKPIKYVTYNMRKVQQEMIGEFRTSSRYDDNWLSQELSQLNYKRMRKKWLRSSEIYQKQYFRNPIYRKTYDPKGRINTEMLDRRLENQPKSLPTVQELIDQADEFLARTDDKSIFEANLKDKQQGYEHFEPRYLNKSLTRDDVWNQVSNSLSEVVPRIAAGDISPRFEPERYEMYINLYFELENESYQPDEQSMETSVQVYNFARTDETFSHFLGSYLSYLHDIADKRSTDFKGFDFQASKHKIMPWETIQSLPESSIPQEQVSKQVELIDERPSGVGKRKNAVSKVWLSPGIGKVTINGRSLIEYFGRPEYRDRVLSPFYVTGSLCEYDVEVGVRGGGIMGQAKAIRLAIARALLLMDPQLKDLLDEYKLLYRDPRVKERKKTSKVKARKSYTYVKR